MSVRLEVEPIPDIADRLRSAAFGIASRHPVAISRARRVWVAWCWLSVAATIVGLVVVPSLRPGFRVLLWCYFMLTGWFLLARTKTITWRTLALTFSAGCLWAWVIVAVELVVARVLGTKPGNQDAGVLIAGPVEETLKFSLLLLGMLFTRRRARRLAVVDFMLLGLASGLGFQLVEDGVRRLVLSSTSPFAQLGLLLHNPSDPTGGWPQYRANLLSGWSDSGGTFWAGHHITTALVATGLGLSLRAFRGRTRWLLPAGLLVMVIFDHMWVNYTLGGHGDQQITLPKWLLNLSVLTLHGHLLVPLLVVGFGAALVIDARAQLLFEDDLPPLAGFGWWQIARHKSAPLLASTNRATRLMGHVIGAGLCLVRELAVIGVAFPGRSRETVAYLRVRREIAHEMHHQQFGAAKGVNPGIPVLAGVVIIAGILATGASLGAAHTPDAHLSGFLAGLLDTLARWWHGLSPTQQFAVTLLVAGLLTLSGVGLVAALGAASTATALAEHGAGAADLLRDPKRAIGRYIRDFTPGQAVDLAAELALQRLVPAGIGARMGGTARRELEHELEDWAAERRMNKTAANQVDEWMRRHERLTNLADANAARRLQEIDNLASGHSYARHGAQTTLDQQHTRTHTGLTPDGLQLQPRDASRFLSHQDQLHAIEQARTIYRQSPSVRINITMPNVAGEGYLKSTGELIRTHNVLVIFNPDGSIKSAYPFLKVWQ